MTFHHFPPFSTIFHHFPPSVQLSVQRNQRNSGSLTNCAEVKGARASLTSRMTSTSWAATILEFQHGSFGTCSLYVYYIFIYLFIYIFMYLLIYFIFMFFWASLLHRHWNQVEHVGSPVLHFLLDFHLSFGHMTWSRTDSQTQGWEHEFRHEIRHELQAVVLSRHVTAAILQYSRPTNQCGWWSKVNIARGTKSANCPWRELTRQRLLRCMASGQPIFPLIFKKSLLNI